MKKLSEYQKKMPSFSDLYDDLAEQNNLLAAEIHDLNKRRVALIVTDSDINQFNKSVDNWNLDNNELKEKLEHSLNMKYHSIIGTLLLKWL